MFVDKNYEELEGLGLCSVLLSILDILVCVGCMIVCMHIW